MNREMGNSTEQKTAPLTTIDQQWRIHNDPIVDQPWWKQRRNSRPRLHPPAKNGSFLSCTLIKRTRNYHKRLNIYTTKVLQTEDPWQHIPKARPVKTPPPRGSISDPAKAIVTQILVYTPSSSFIFLRGREPFRKIRTAIWKYPPKDCLNLSV